jgi:hypothetical protein
MTLWGFGWGLVVLISIAIIIYYIYRRAKFLSSIATEYRIIELKKRLAKEDNVPYGYFHCSLCNFALSTDILEGELIRNDDTPANNNIYRICLVCASRCKLQQLEDGTLVHGVHANGQGWIDWDYLDAHTYPDKHMKIDFEFRIK